jgi:hypothetical protein
VYLTNVLSVLSIDVGLSDAGVARLLDSIRTNPDKREYEGLQQELQALLGDTTTDWMALLDNELHEVAFGETQEDARRFVVETLWRPLFEGR